MAAQFDQVAFDLDGTLVDSADDLIASVHHVLASLGRPRLPASTVRGFVGNGARALVQQAMTAVGETRVDLALDRFLAHYGAHLLDRTRPYPGIPSLLDALAAAAVPLAVLSNKPVALCRSILAGLGWTARFAVVLGGDSLPTRKPDPAGLSALRRRGGGSPGRLLLVGDSLVDLETARAGGASFCGVGWGLAPAVLRAAQPERWVDHPSELVAVVLGDGASVD